MLISTLWTRIDWAAAADLNANAGEKILLESDGERANEFMPPTYRRICVGVCEWVCTFLHQIFKWVRARDRKFMIAAAVAQHALIWSDELAREFAYDSADAQLVGHFLGSPSERTSPTNGLFI